MNINNCNHTDTEKHQEEKIFLYTTITGNLQLIHLEQIGYFRYNSKSKLWEAVLNNNHTLALKRNTNSQKILSLHPYLIQISQSHIINISYLYIAHLYALCNTKQFHFEDQCRVGRNRIKRFDTVSHCIRNINNPFITNMHFLKCHLPPFYYITKT